MQFYIDLTTLTFFTITPIVLIEQTDGQHGMGGLGTEHTPDMIESIMTGIAKNENVKGTKLIPIGSAITDVAFDKDKMYYTAKLDGQSVKMEDIFDYATDKANISCEISDAYNALVKAQNDIKKSTDEIIKNANEMRAHFLQSAQIDQYIYADDSAEKDLGEAFDEYYPDEKIEHINETEEK